MDGSLAAHRQEAVPPGLFSPDGLWWFDGAAWRPAVSPDGRWRWTGQTWVSTRRPPSPSWVKACGVAWLASLSAWLLLLIIAAAGSADLPSWAPVPVLGLAAVAAVATLAWGAILGHQRAWWPLALSAPVGAGVLLFWYVLSMDFSNEPGADDPAAVGLMMLTVPTLIVVALLLYIGGGAGALVRRRSARSPR